MRHLCLLTLLLACLRPFAQPGPPHLSLNFHAYDAEGREIIPADRRFTVTFDYDRSQARPSREERGWMEYRPYERNINDTNRHCFLDGGFHYQMIGFRLPPGFHVLLIHGLDSMKIFPTALSDFSSYAVLPLVRFRKGSYQVPAGYFYPPVFFADSKPIAPDWADFEISRDGHLPYYFVERTRDATFGELFFPERQPEGWIPFTSLPDSICTSRKTYFWKYARPHGPALSTNWHDDLLTAITFNSADLLVQERGAHELITHTVADSALPWRTFWPAPPLNGNYIGRVPGYEFSIKQIHFNTEKQYFEALATIQERNNELTVEQQLKLTGWYRIYFNIKMGTPAYKELVQKIDRLIAEATEKK